MTYSIETLKNGTKVLCSGEHRFGTDALLLARFSLPHRNWRVADLCSGCGIVALEWFDIGHRGECFAVEISAKASEQLLQAKKENCAENIISTCEDLRLFRLKQQGSFELVACNPPYFEMQTGETHKNAEHARARHEQECTLEDVAKCAARLLKDGGKFTLCHRPQRLAEVFETLKKHRLEPKRLAFVKNKNSGKPWLFLLEAQKNRKTGLIVEEDILITNGEAMY